ncbi:hypothetical protein [Desulfosarcina sp.]|uniref:hypothetical protein n=1 Tax=Desulfosarcina sp. TaxID=2027861 RepID=UPI003970617F
MKGKTKESDSENRIIDTDQSPTHAEPVIHAAARMETTTTANDDESLDAEQQKAFESIMAQIEGGGADADTEAPSDDFSAELEMVVNEAAAAEAGGPMDETGNESDQGLDADQQKAFENIMTQIEGGGADADTEPPSDDFSAELEMVVNEAAAAEAGGPMDGTGNESDQGLDADQQKAFESIMAQIGAKAPEKPSSEISESDSTAVGANEQENHPTDVIRDQSVAEAEAQDVSDDINLILDAITSSNEPVSVSATDADFPSPPSALQSGEPATSEENPSPGYPTLPSTADVNSGPTAIKNVRPEAETVEKATTSVGGTRKKAFIALAVAIGLLALAGYVQWRLKNDVISKAPLSTADMPRPDGVAAIPPPAQPNGPITVDLPPSDHAQLKTAAEKLHRLRGTLLEKQTEIQALRAYYQAGIDAEIAGIVEILHKTSPSEVAFGAAMDHPLISLGLSAIQRRDNYITKLANPLNDLLWSSESLLFYARKSEMLALMVGKTSDLDIDGFLKQVDEISAMHGRVLAQLDIDAVPSSPLELESIWQQIVKRLQEPPHRGGKALPVRSAEDVAIWKNICAGDFSQKHNLTELSPEAAGCLAQWKGKDLFLNALTQLPADAARQLAAWEGDWLGLNGLKELSADAAMQLSRWKGKKLSLNGLSRLSPRVVAILSEWQGDQIELVNVKQMAHWENPNTRLFLSEDLHRGQNTTRK